MTIATSTSASRNGAGIRARERSTRRSKATWGGELAGRPAIRAPRRRFGMAAYRRHVASPIDPAAERTDVPPGFVVLVEPGDRIHFLDWGGTGRPAVVL